MRLLYWIFIIALFIAACQQKKGSENIQSPRIKKLTKISSPKPSLKVMRGKTLSFELFTEEGHFIDSITIRLGSDIVFSGQKSSGIELPTNTQPVGKSIYDLVIYLDGGIVERKRRTVIITSDVIPTSYSYRTVNEYAHDNNAFTQGLLIHGGELYESTGRNGWSSLRLVDLPSGEVDRIRNISNDYFSEGISIVNNKIYMLTYHAGKCFTFDVNTFEPLQEYYYPGQGWGLTNIGDTLVRSDGSETLFFMEPAGFTEIRRIDVYDRDMPVDQLNELEYIDGKLYANRWMTDIVYIIDPTSGVVEGKIDLSNLLPENQKTTDTDVLNGIAYNARNKKIYVTGKLWPKLYEIKLIKKEKGI